MVDTQRLCVSAVKATDKDSLLVQLV